MRQPILKHTQIIRLSRFLDMMYRPSEIAEEIGVTQDTIYRSYLPAGLPHERDEIGNVWIHGPAFVAWAKETVAKRKTRRQGLPSGHGWCMRCNRPVPLRDTTVRTVNRYLELEQAPCPECGCVVNRARARRKRVETKSRSGAKAQVSG